MSILIKNFHETEFIKLPGDQYYTLEMILSSIDAILLFLGLGLETLVIASILRVHQKSVDTLFVLSLCCADFIFNLYQIPALLIVLAAGGWQFGGAGCKISTAMIVTTLAISITSITFITLNRYLAILHKQNITRNQAVVMITSAWIVLTAISILYISNKELAEKSIALQPSRLYCFYDFGSDDAVVITGLITILCFMAVPLLFLIIAYSQIIVFYRSMNRRWDEYVFSQVYKSEKKLLIKAIAITMTFFATYSVELIVRLYQFVTKKDVHLIIDLVGTMGICSNTLLNSIILLNYDAHVQKSALEMLGLEEWWKSRKSEKSTIKSNVEKAAEKKTSIQNTQPAIDTIELTPKLLIIH